MPDIYDEEIEVLKQAPEEIDNHWMAATPLFKMIRINTDKYSEEYLSTCYQKNIKAGCLTQIRKIPEMAKAFINNQVDENLTALIATDERIPANANDITLEHLPVFAEWQRRIDALQNQ